jgi:hypothetical protein
MRAKIAFTSVAIAYCSAFPLRFLFVLDKGAAKMVVADDNG